MSESLTTRDLLAPARRLRRAVPRGRVSPRSAASLGETCPRAGAFTLVPICVALIAATALAGDAQRLAPPTKEAREAAEKVVNELLGAQIEQANRGSAEAKLTLAKTLMKQAAETNDNAAARFVMYQKARDLAAAGGDVTIAMSAIDRLAVLYEIDAPNDRFTTLSGSLKNIRSPEAGQAALDAALAAIDEAILADDFDVAGKLVRLAAGLAARLHNGPIASQLKGRPAEIEQLKKESAKAADAQNKLSTAPDDPAANLTVGYFQGPMKGDFSRGLPFLAKCSDAALADLAKKELAAPAEPAEQATLADGWWDAAEHQREPAKSHTRAHAVALYEKSLPHLKGLTKAEAESRIKQFEVDHPTAIGLSRTAIVKVLTDGDWRIKWFASTSDYSGPVASEYPAFVFCVDGSCSHAKLKWRFMDNSATVEIADLSSAYPFLQRFTLVGATLRCENFNPPGKLLNLGLGTKNPR